MSAESKSIWASGRPRWEGRWKDDAGRKLYSVGYTEFRNNEPFAGCDITFWAFNPSKALTAIEDSGKPPYEFHQHRFDV